MRPHRLSVVMDAISYRSPRLVRQVFQTNGGSAYPVCPRCDCTIEREYMSFCDRCGQKLGWGLFSYATVRHASGRKI